MAISIVRRRSGSNQGDVASRPLERRVSLAADLYPTIQLSGNGNLGIAPDGEVQVSVNIYNNGDGTAPAGVPYRLVVAADYNLTQSVTVIRNDTLDEPIAAEAGQFLPFEFDVPGGLVGKRMYVGIIVDPDDVFDEGLPGTRQDGPEESDASNNRVATEVKFASNYTAGATLMGTDGDDGILFTPWEDYFYITGAAGSPQSGVQVAPISTWSSVVTVELKDGNDSFNASIYGDELRYDIRGGDGNDVIESGPYNDTVDGGAGDDAIRAGVGSDLLSGGDGNDYLYGNDGNDTVNGGAGNDRIEGAAGADSLHGNTGNDALYGGGDDDLMWGDAGRDVMRGGAGNDRMAGGANPDDLLGDAGDDTLIGNGGRDKLRGGAGADRLLGNAGNDILGDKGETGVDTLSGSAGNDEVYSDAGDILSSIELQHA